MTHEVFKPVRLLIGVMAFALIGACSDQYDGAVPDKDSAYAADADLVANSYQAAERLLRGLQQPLDMTKPVLVATLVDVADMRQSTDLGRIISE